MNEQTGTKITPDKLKLLTEYNLNEIQYRILCLISAEAGLIWWGNRYHQKKLREISGQPAPTLRKLVTQKILTGPSRDELIALKPFELTTEGRDILARIEAGLHSPSWLSEHKARALHFLNLRPETAINLRLLGIRKVTLNSLVKANYISNGGLDYAITNLGREALSEFNPPSPSGRGAGGEGQEGGHDGR